MTVILCFATDRFVDEGRLGRSPAPLERPEPRIFRVRSSEIERSISLFAAPTDGIPKDGVIGAAGPVRGVRSTVLVGKSLVPTQEDG